MIHSFNYHRKTSPGVKRGKVQKTNRMAETSSYWNTAQSAPVVDRAPPGKGFRHFLTPRDICSFVGILPAWEHISQDLQAVLLAPGETGVDGWYTSSVVAIVAWEEDCWRTVPSDYYHLHKDLLDRLGVSCSKQGNEYLCQFFPASIRAFQLLHVFLHELGHHYDRMTTRSKIESSRGEMFAENYATRYSDLIWNRYLDVFKL